MVDFQDNHYTGERPEHAMLMVWLGSWPTISIIMHLPFIHLNGMILELVMLVKRLGTLPIVVLVVCFPLGFRGFNQPCSNTSSWRHLSGHVGWYLRRSDIVKGGARGGLEANGGCRVCYVIPDRVEVEASNAVTTSMVPVCYPSSSILFGPSSTYSYVAYYFTSDNNIMCESLAEPICVSTPVGQSLEVN